LTTNPDRLAADPIKRADRAAPTVAGAGWFCRAREPPGALRIAAATGALRLARMRASKLSMPLLAAAALAGCGASSSPVSTSKVGPTTAPTTRPGSGPHTATTGHPAPVKAAPVNDRAHFIAAADALCKSSNVRQEVLSKRAKGISNAKLVPLLHEQGAIAQGLATGLGKLAPPAGDGAAVQRFVTAVQQLAVYSVAVANSVAAGHSFVAHALATKLTAARQQEKLLGQGYGYKICSSGKAY